MAQYGRLRITVLDASGNAVSSASVEVRKQGATVQGNHGVAATSFTVDDPGAITTAGTADVVAVDTGSTTRTVASFTATNVTVGAPGFDSVNDDSRLTVTNNLPTLYNDVLGNETKANPLTTDANGRAICWTQVRPVDVLISGTGVTTTLLQDVIPDGHERIVSNVIGGAGPAFILDTQRALTTDDKILSIRENTVEKFSVDDDGDVVCAKINASGTVAAAGAATVGTTLTVSGASTTTGITNTGAISTTTGFTQSGAISTNTLNSPTTFGASATVTLTGTAGNDILTVTNGNVVISAGRLQHRAWQNFANLDLTPDVSSGNRFRAINTGAASVTNFDNGINGQEIIVWTTTANTTFVHDATKLKMLNGVNYNPTADTVLVFVADNTSPIVWFEVSRSKDVA